MVDDYIGLGCFAIIAIIGLSFGITCLVALLIQCVASGFGYSLPYWPIVGLLYVLHIIGGLVFGKK